LTEAFCLTLQFRQRYSAVLTKRRGKVRRIERVCPESTLARSYA
jgi:hypothetical protein